ncbi:WXG100 family type VII secretion target [Haloactinomyces albus]|uniref:Uncharacterized protein YukE n=1 Tax=Haloactinomyces albus TaxID=1352928 RepID=A0AAE3ZGE5_9ACTN|nr:hypothetical protein [Haloactinomyces albus]MDR7302519.1 uncharacterized protein YukE [Haloactinomyces albus]
MSTEAPGTDVNSSVEPEPEENSDFHLKKLSELEDVMKTDNWGRVFKRWREHPAAAKHYPGSEYPVYGTGFIETHDIPGIEGIDWGALNATADKIAQLGNHRSDWAGDVDSLQKRLDQAWQGTAADAAREQYLAMKKSINTYCDTASAFSRHLRSAAQVPRGMIGPGGLSDFKERSVFWKSYGQDDQSEDMLDDINGMEKMISDGYLASPSSLSEYGPFGRAVFSRTVDKAMRENHMISLEDARKTDNYYRIQVSWDDLKLPGSPGCRVDRGILWSGIAKGDGQGGTSAHDRIKWLDTFCHWYANDVDNLRKRVHEAYTLTEEAWNELGNQLGKLDVDSFGKLSMGDARASPSRKESQEKSSNKPGENTAPDQSGTGDAGSAAPTGGGVSGGNIGGATGGGSSGGIPGGGVPSGMAGGGSAAAPQSSQMPTPPEMPKPGDAAPSSEASSSPGNPPSFGPDQPLVPPQSPGEQVTVGEGDNRISVQEPDRSGNVELTVLGEDGQPRTYEIGFGTDSQPEVSQPEVSQPEVLQSESSRPDVPQQTMPGQAEPSGQFAVPGQSAASADAVSPSSPNGPVQVSAGQDGTARIEDGNRTITVERAPSGELSLSVDNGDGAPQSYTVDFGDQGGAQQQPSVPPQGQATTYSAFDGQGPLTVDAPASSPGMADSPAPSVQAGAPQTPATGFGQEFAANPVMSTSASAEASSNFATTPVDSSNFPASTTPQSAGFATSPSTGFTAMSGFGAEEGIRNSFGSASGNLFASADGFASTDSTVSSQWGQPVGNPQSQGGATAFASMGGDATGASSQGATGMASMGAVGGGEGSSGTSGSGSSGAMPMGMGGMGGAGQQGGGDEERSNDSPWRTQGDLFDDGIEAGAGFQYRAVLGEDEDK